MFPHHQNPAVEARELIGVAEELLKNRDLSASKTYAVRAGEVDAGVKEESEKIIAVADILMAGDKRIGDRNPDWYGILQVPSRSSDKRLMASQYLRFSRLLSTKKNECPSANSAYWLIIYAWLVLSDPVNKSQYDSEISTCAPPPQENSPAPENSPISSHKKATTFWTACPYCYHFYEYPEAFVECALRCQNCRRVFHGVRVGTPPTVTAGEDKPFQSFGFYQLGGAAPFTEKK